MKIWKTIFWLLQIIAISFVTNLLGKSLMNRVSDKYFADMGKLKEAEAAEE